AGVVRLLSEQALRNLIENSFRHAAGKIRLSAIRSGDSVELHVSDEGPGFPPEFAEHAFERFARAEESRTSSGAGLGLAIVAAVAEAHGGSAAVGEGAVVSIRVPTEPSSAPVQPRSPRRYLPSSRSTTLHFPS